MTLQNLGKVLDKYDYLTLIPTGESFFLKDLKFYNFYNHTDIGTFNHAIGLPKKNGHEYPLFEYEQLLYDAKYNIANIVRGVYGCNSKISSNSNNSRHRISSSNNRSRCSNSDNRSN